MESKEAVRCGFQNASTVQQFISTKAVACTSRRHKVIDPAIEKIQRDPAYLQLRNKRNKLGLTLTVLMLVVYYGYVALIAFDKEFLAQPIGAGVTTLGIPIALFVIIFTVAITLFYIRRANNEFDKLTAKIIKDAKQ